MFVPGARLDPPVPGVPGDSADVGATAEDPAASDAPQASREIISTKTGVSPPRPGHLPLFLGRGLPLFVGMGALVAIFLGYAAYAWGVIPHDGRRVYELNNLLWMPFALQGSALITVAQEGGRAIIDDPRITNPVLMVQTIFYWIALGLGSSGGLVNLLGVAGILKHPVARSPRRSRRGPSLKAQAKGSR